MNPSRTGAPSGPRNPFASGSATNPAADPRLHAQARGLGAANRSTQPASTGGSGPADPWYYGSHSLGQSSQVAGPQTSTYYATPSQQEAYVRQYQQWAESYPTGPQQDLMPFATPADGGHGAYNNSSYADLRGGSYDPNPVQSAAASQGHTGQQFSSEATYQRQNPVDPVYAGLYGLVGTTSAVPGHSSTQSNEHVQAPGQYGYPSQGQAQPRPSRPQAPAVQYQAPSVQAQHNQLPQRHAQSHDVYTQRQAPSRDRTLSSSPVSLPSEAPPSAGAVSLTANARKPARQVSGGQRAQQHLSVPGPSGHKESISSAPPSLGGGAKNKRKRIKRDDDSEPEDADSAEESEDEDPRFAGGISVGVAGFGVASRARKGRNSKHSRLTGACKHCKKLKMKCEFSMGDPRTCNRCKTSGYACIVEGRKPRNAPNKREYLLAQIRQKDSVIESLLKQLHNPYVATPLSIASYRLATSPSDKNNQDVLEWLEQLVASVRDSGSKSDTQAFLHPREKKDAEESDNEEPAGGKDDDADDDPETSNSEPRIGSSLPDAHVPIGLIANLSLSNKKPSRKQKKGDKVDEIITLAEDDFNDDNVGVANETYFMPGPATDLGIRATLINQHSPPEILVHGLVTPSDVNQLFEIFFDRINPFTSLLDRKIHNPETTFARCPFLFTVVCAVASRYYSEKSQVYPVAMHFAKSSAATALIDGWKSVELCQAYILMATYAVPARRWEEDRSWLYTGLAIRIATDLNLHQVSTVKPTSEMQEREILNKRRVWLICYNLDRSTATQFGKPSTIKEDYIVRNAKDWYKSSQYNHQFDVHLVGYSALLQIVARFHDEIFSDPSSPTGLNKNVDFHSVTLEHDARLIAFEEEWTRRFDEDSKPDDPACNFRRSLMPFLVSYSRLVMYSFGFQQALLRGLQKGDEIYFTKCMESAKAVIVSMLDDLAPSGYMRYAPDGHFVFASFASAFLLKLLRPELSKYLTKESEAEIFDLITQLINTLSSNDIAIDDRHTPRLYARFLAGLLFRHRRDGVTMGRLQTQPQPPSKQGSGGPTPGGSMTTFSVSPPTNTTGTSGTSGYGTQGGSSYDTSGNAGDSIIFTPEATFGAGTGPVHFGPGDLNSYSVNAFTEEETLATMQVINNPAWWKDVLMPGFSGSWPEASPSPPASGPSSSGSPYLPGSGRYALGSSPQTFGSDLTGSTGSFNIFHSMQMGNTEIPLY